MQIEAGNGSSCRKQTVIGVLALQGGVFEHMQSLRTLADITCLEIHTPSELQKIDGLIIPGGESSALRSLIVTNGLFEPLQERLKKGLVIWGTCAGAILLANHILGDEEPFLSGIDMMIQRNGYGSQLDSFIEQIPIPEFGETPFEAVCIRAPKICQVGKSVEILAEGAGGIMACRNKTVLVSTFHPELTQDCRFHSYFTNMVVSNIV